MKMTKVTESEFFATVGQMDAHPRSEKDASYWELRNRTLVGKSTPGYMCDGERAYFVVENE